MVMRKQGRRTDGFYNYLGMLPVASEGTLLPPNGPVYTPQLPSDDPAGANPIPVVFTWPNPTYEINYNALSCPELQQKMAELGAIMGTLPPGQSGWEYYSLKLTQAQTAHTSVCGAVNCLVPPCPGSSIPVPPNPKPNNEGNTGNNNSTTNVSILPSGTGIAPTVITGGGIFGGGGGSASGGSATKATGLAAIIEKYKKFWWLVAIGVVGVAVYKTRK